MINTKNLKRVKEMPYKDKQLKQTNKQTDKQKSNIQLRPSRNTQTCPWKRKCPRQDKSATCKLTPSRYALTKILVV